MNIENEILAKYGSNVYVALGTVADEITAKYQAAWDNGVYTDNALPGQAMMNQLCGRTPEAAVISDAWNELKKASLNLWMSGVSREQMVAALCMLSAVPGGMFLSVAWLHGAENLTDMALMRAWNEAHPDEAPIYSNDEALLA